VSRPTVPAVEVRQLTYEFGPLRAVDDISFAVEPGEVFGLLGPNGAGKTTTIRILITLLKPRFGTVEVFGVDVHRFPMRARSMLGYVPQQLSIDAQLTGYENVWLFARLFDVPRRERRARVRDVLQLVGLEGAAGQIAREYSGGMIRRLELAQALVDRPRVLVLDEPTIGLDPIARSAVWERILGFRRDLGMTILLTTHYMDEAEELCDRVGFMHLGRLQALGRPEDLKAALGPDRTLADVFRSSVGGTPEEEGGSFRDVRSTRRTATRMG
jgi:ABC-2 type transport system ATP-binding protein